MAGRRSGNRAIIWSLRLIVSREFCHIKYRGIVPGDYVRRTMSRGLCQGIRSSEISSDYHISNILNKTAVDFAASYCGGGYDQKLYRS